MTEMGIAPGPVQGRLLAPPSKSYTHRALVAGFLSGRAYHVHRPNLGDDAEATLEGLARLGATVLRRRNGWTIHRTEGRPHGRSLSIDCRSSGTSLRFLAAVAALGPVPVRLRGSEELARRPLAPLVTALRSGGARVRSARGHGSVPVTVQGPIHAGTFTVPGATSSQFASALLLTLPTVDGPSRLCIEGTLVSAPYLDATESVLAAHGIRVRREGPAYALEGGARYEGRQFFVPGDASSAAYLWAAAALTGGRARVGGIDPRWPQADLLVLSILEAMGARVRRHDHAVTVEGPLVRGCDVDLTPAPDLAPLVGVLAALAPRGTSRLILPPHLAFKESDRRAATVRLARLFGAGTRRVADTLEVRPGERPASIHLRRARDHRVVMSAAVGALGLRRPSRVGTSEAVAKSFPGFWSALGALGVPVEVLGG
jgi:3-phosphoshikimate 1-carboxyvinyltransferase